MQSRPLVSVDMVVDDETGIWEVGELEHTIYLDDIDTFLAKHDDGRQKLGLKLRLLAPYFETGEWPNERSRNEQLPIPRTDRLVR